MAMMGSLGVSSTPSPLPRKSVSIYISVKRGVLSCALYIYGSALYRVAQAPGYRETGLCYDTALNEAGRSVITWVQVLG